MSPSTSALGVTADGLLAVLRGALYSPETTALLPLAIEQASEGEPKALVALAVASAGTGATRGGTGPRGALFSPPPAPPPPLFFFLQNSAYATSPLL